jgi:hypothetical protein
VTRWSTFLRTSARFLEYYCFLRTSVHFLEYYCLCMPPRGAWLLRRVLLFLNTSKRSMTLFSRWEQTTELLTCNVIGCLYEQIDNSLPFKGVSRSGLSAIYVTAVCLIIYMLNLLLLYLSNIYKNDVYLAFSGLGAMTGATWHFFPFRLYLILSKSDGYGLIFEDVVLNDFRTCVF